LDGRYASWTIPILALNPARTSTHVCNIRTNVSPAMRMQGFVSKKDRIGKAVTGQEATSGRYMWFPALI
jgi:hypothetical protein